METKNINIKDIKTNDGQIEGLPRNPRQIRDARFEALKKSITDAPEMLQLRELLVYPHGGKFVIVGGNMRYRACKELGYKELSCKVLDAETPVEKLRQYAIKDNENFGEYDWDVVANEWDTAELEDWGVELPTDWGDELTDQNEGEAKKETIKAFKKSFILVSCECDDATEIAETIQKALQNYSFQNCSKQMLSSCHKH